MGKEESNSRKFERPKDLDLISKLSSKHQKPKTKNYNKDNEYESDLRCNEVNMEYIYIWLSYIHSYKLQTLTFNLHRNCLGAVINQERKLQLKNELNFTIKMKHS